MNMYQPLIPGSGQGGASAPNLLSMATTPASLALGPLGYGLTMYDQHKNGTGMFGPKDPYGGNQFNAEYPSYQKGYDPNTMAMAPQVQNELNGVNLDTRGLDKFRNEALRTGPSRWAGLQVGKTYGEEQAARERAKQEALSGTSQAQSDLAMHGGLSSGARERTAQTGQRSELAMSQQAGRQGAQNRLQVGINDESNRIAQLSQLPAFEQQVYGNQFQKAQALNQAHLQDVQNQIAETNRLNEYNATMAGLRNQANATNQQANFAAQQEAHSGLLGMGGFLGTGLGGPNGLLGTGFL